MNKGRRVALIIILGVMVMEIFGCGQLSSNEEVARELLNKEYNEEFEIEKIVNISVMDGYYTAVAYPVKQPEMLFTVRVNSDGSGESDNYISKAKCLELSDKLARNLDGIDGLHYVYSEPLYDPVIKDKDITLEGYLATNPDRIYNVYLVLDPNQMDMEKSYKLIADMCNGISPLNLNVLVYAADENGLKEISSYMENHDIVYDDFDHSGGQYYKDSFKFRKGKIDITVEELARMLRG